MVNAAGRMTDDMGHLQWWLIRDDEDWDYSIPSTIDQAQQKLTATMNDIRASSPCCLPTNTPPASR